MNEKSEKQAFLDEMFQCLESIDDEIRKMRVRVSKESYELIYRKFHTMKGLCSALKYTNLTSIVHEYESCLAMLLRMDAIKLIEYSAPEKLSFINQINDLLFKVRDQLISTDDDYVDNQDIFLKKIKFEMDYLVDTYGSQLLSEQASTKNTETTSKKKRKRKLSPLQQEFLQNISHKNEEALEESQKTLEEKIIRLDAKTLDNLNNKLEDLLTVKNSIESFCIENNLNSFELKRFDDLTEKIKNSIIDINTEPLSSISSQFFRLVRQLSGDLGKDVELTLENQDLKLDRDIIESLQEPLLHLFRNAIDHGIESAERRLELGKKERASIKLSMHQDGMWVYLSVIDDGAGINAEKVKSKALDKALYTEQELEAMSEEEIFKIILNKGFSTSKAVSDISGRGIGMDVVSDFIKKFNGDIAIESTINEGTKFTLKLPFSMGVRKVMQVEINGQSFLIPENFIQEVSFLEKDEFGFIALSDSFEFRKVKIPIIIGHTLLNPNEEFKLREFVEDKKYFDYLIMRSGDFAFAFFVDRVVGMYDVIVTPLDLQSQKIDLFSSSAILANGSLGLVFNIQYLMQQYGRNLDLSKLDFAEQRYKELNQAEIEAELKKIKELKSIDFVSDKLEKENFDRKINQEKYLIFEDLDNSFALGIDLVIDIVHNYKIIQLPNLGNKYLGAISLKNELILVESAAKTLQMSDNKHSNEPSFIIIELKDKKHALICDQILDTSNSTDNCQIIDQSSSIFANDPLDNSSDLKKSLA